MSLDRYQVTPRQHSWEGKKLFMYSRFLHQLLTQRSHCSWYKFQKGPEPNHRAIVATNPITRAYVIVSLWTHIELRKALGKDVLIVKTSQFCQSTLKKQSVPNISVNNIYHNIELLFFQLDEAQISNKDCSHEEKGIHWSISIKNGLHFQTTLATTDLLIKSSD